MGNVQHKRPIKYPWMKAISSGIETTGPAVFGGVLNCSSDLDVVGATTLTNALIQPIQALANSGTINGFGITTLSATSAATPFTLPTPVAGQFKAIFQIQADSTATSIASFAETTGSTGLHFASSDSTIIGLRKAVFNANNEGLLLYGVSASEWFIAQNIGSVTISSTT